MADDITPPSGPLPSPLASHPPDLMDDPSFPLPTRRDTASSDQAPTCRICRSDGTSDEPLFHPCKCSGSIKFVHQECLMEWLSHSHKKHCELCKTPFRFTKLYDANMPHSLPWAVFIRRACAHLGLSVMRACRGLLVSAIWLVMLPWMVRWSWRWMFWIADAGWAREAFMNRQFSSGATVTETAKFAKEFLDNFGLSALLGDAVSQQNATASHNNPRSVGPQADTSILSSWTYISELTSNASLNRIILDIFEGQLITCVVITGFILVFLIREWVVQQQPLVNLDNRGHVHQHLREAAERVQADNERLVRQQELLEQGRRRLLQLQHEEQSSGDAARTADTQAQPRRQSDSGPRQPSHELSGRQSEAEGLDTARRPSMPDRDTFSRATQIRRLLEEAEGAVSPMQANTDVDQHRPFVGNVDVPELLAEVAAAASSNQESSLPVSLPDGRKSISDNGNNPSNEIASAAADDEMPITNAGPDAKINIRRSGTCKPRAVPEPKDDESIVVSDADLKQRLKQDTALRRLEDEIKAEDAARITHDAGSQERSGGGVSNDSQMVDGQNEDTSRPREDGPRDQQSESTDGHVTSAFREDLGSEEAEARESSQQADLVPNGDIVLNDGDAEELAPMVAEAPPSRLQRLVDWFWGDIQPQNVPDPIPADGEERVEEEINVQQEAPFVPIVNGQAVPPAAAARLAAQDLDPDQDQDQDHDHDPEHADPEVVAAAQAAGLDAEAIEDAEDLEGIFELVGLQGPLIGLFQTSTFCTVLVTGSVYGAVGLPYVWGKLVLSFLASPMWFLIQMPLQAASFIADFVVDLTLLIGGWSVFGGALGADFLLSVMEVWVPKLGDVSVSDWIFEFATTTAKASGARLQDLFVTTEPAENAGLGWNWAFLWASVHSHASLKEIEGQVHGILDYTGRTITFIVETISTGSFSLVAQRTFHALAEVADIPAKLVAGVEAFKQYFQPLLELVNSLRTGALTFQTHVGQQFEPSLAYWSSTDRFLAVLVGYVAFALIAAVYVAVDTPMTRTEADRKTEKVIRDTLRQAGGVLKVILIISIEMLVFPLYCGLLLDLAFLPLFRDASVATRWQWAGERPYLFCFVHWFVGTCYMFHFALFVGMCRKILRKGVLWFIRDPDDPTFHPVRDVLERNVTTQLRKIAFSALVYGALVILCLGGVIWTIGRVFKGIFPIYWISTEPVLEFPLDLILYNAVTPLVIRLFRPSDAVNAMYGWWLRRCARVLRLSHFLFDDRRKDEEGHHVRKSWSSYVLMRTAMSDEQGQPMITHNNKETPEVRFERDGKYVLTPCNDQYRPPKPGEAFLHTTPTSTSNGDDYDVFVADKDGKKNDHFAKVYVPPHFRLRITLFMVCLWIFSAFTGLCATLVPLCFGRTVIASFMPRGIRVNDIYAYSAGAYILGGVLFAVLKARSRLSTFTVPAIDVFAVLRLMKQFAIRSIACLYVYGFAGVVLPVVVALVLQFYVILPMHTWTASHATTAPTMSPTSNSSASLGTNMTETETSFIQHATQDLSSPLADRLAIHTIHTLQDYCLGLLYVRVLVNALVLNPGSRPAEAFRRITADGYLNPNVRLATRFLVLPVTVLSALVLLTPPALAKAALSVVEGVFHRAPLEAEDVVRLYRYSYPLAASWVVVLLAGLQFGKATGRWRQSIKDEVYLVGERLHNFGEKKPPAGSRSVVRKER